MVTEDLGLRERPPWAQEETGEATNQKTWLAGQPPSGFLGGHQRQGVKFNMTQASALYFEASHSTKGRVVVPRLSLTLALGMKR